MCHGKTETEHREIIYGLNGRNRNLREFKIGLHDWADKGFKNGLLSLYWTGREFIDDLPGHNRAGREFRFAFLGCAWTDRKFIFGLLGHDRAHRDNSEHM